MQRLLKRNGISTVVCDQCPYGLYSRCTDGSYKLSLKPTRWASNSPFMLERLSERCTNYHQRESLMGKNARDAAYYPPALILEILRGMRDTADHARLHDDEGRVLAAATTQNSDVAIPPSVASHQQMCDERDRVVSVADSKPSFFRRANWQKTQIKMCFKQILSGRVYPGGVTPGRHRSSHY